MVKSFGIDKHKARNDETVGLLISLRNNHDRYGAVVDDVVAAAAEERATNLIEPTCSHHDGVGFVLLGIPDDSLSSILHVFTHNFVLDLTNRYCTFIKKS